MSTRRLILTALLCGLGILLAGGVQLVRISRSGDRVVVLSEGQEVVVGGARAKVVSSRRVGDRVEIDVTLSVPSTAPGDGRSAADPWSLLAGGVISAPLAADGSCSAQPLTATGPISCRVVFAAADGTKTLAFRWGDGQRQWHLAV